MTALCLVATPFVIVAALGYRFDPVRRAVRRTGAILVATHPRGATVAVDGRAWRERTPTAVRHVLPGSHALRVSRPPFAPWERTANVTAGQTVLFNDVKLVRADAPWVTQRTIAGTGARVSHAGTHLAWLTAQGTAVIGQTESAANDRRAAAARAVLAWSPSDRYVLLQLDGAVGAIDRSASIGLADTPARGNLTVTRFPLAGPVQTVRWNSAAEGLIYLQVAGNRWSVLDLVASTLTYLPIVAEDLLARGDTLATLETGDLTDQTRQLVVRRSPGLTVLERRPLAVRATRFLAHAWQPFLLTDGALLVWSDDAQPQRHLSEPIVEALRRPDGHLLTWGTSEVWYRARQPSDDVLVGRYGQVDAVAPVAGWPLLIIAADGELRAEDADRRGGQYRVPLGPVAGRLVDLRTRGDALSLVTEGDGTIVVSDRQVF